MRYAEAVERANQYSGTVRADDSRMRGSVLVLHEEGTTLYFRYAFALKLGEYIVIITEHHGTHVYADDDVKVLRFTSELYDRLEELPA